MTDEDDGAAEVVDSVGRLDAVVVLLREFLHRSGALRAVAVVESPDATAVVDCGRLAPVEVTVGERTVCLPHTAELDAESLPVPEVRQLPPFDVDAGTGEIAAPLGGVEMLAGGVRELASTLGGRSVAFAQFATTTPGLPLSFSARVGEPLVVAIGEDEYEMDAGWP
jgi:hypothetical protein